MTQPQPPGTYILCLCATMELYSTALEKCEEFTVIIEGPDCTYTINSVTPSSPTLTYEWGSATASTIDLSSDLDSFSVSSSASSCAEKSMSFIAVYKDLEDDMTYIEG